MNHPNVIIILADQWRGQATGYAGDQNAKTPNIDALARESVTFTRAFSGIPVCTPARACLLTGKYPSTHGVFLNDVHLRSDEDSIAFVFNRAGYDTAYVGKWHLDGHGSRSIFIPKERRQGFDYWKALECTHSYFNSAYYKGNDPAQLHWDGYDALAQTRDVVDYIRGHERHKTFFLMLSWGPPHNPYQDVPKQYKRKIKPRKINLRPNVPEQEIKRARKDLAGYYAHLAALDDCVGMIVQALEETALAENTMLVFTSDHGDMLGSQGQHRKQRPWDESISIPLVLKVPWIDRHVAEITMPIDLADLMPTILGLCHLQIPASVQATDVSKHVIDGTMPEDNAVLISCIAPFGEFTRNHGGREYRGVRTRKYTYVRDLNGPWLLYNNDLDPYQMRNLVGDENYEKILAELDDTLNLLLRKRG
nr:sulfatase [Candidatus Sigynarchaeota archaeon]